MRYEGNCEKFCTEGKLTGELWEDPIVMAGQRKAEIADEINKLRKGRFDYCTIVMDGKNPAIKVTDQIQFEGNIENEQNLMTELASLIKIFNQLNPLFGEIQTKYKFLRSPTLTGVR